MTPATIYWLFTLSNLPNSLALVLAIFIAIGIAGLVLFLIGLITIVFYHNEYEFEERKISHTYGYVFAVKIQKKGIKIGSIFLVSAVLLNIVFALAPSKQTIIAMYLIPAVVNNKSVQELPADLHQWLLKEISQKEHE